MEHSLCAGRNQSQSPLGRDYERYAMTVAAFIRLAMIRFMLKRLATQTPRHESNALFR